MLKLKERRQKAGLSQEELASRIGVEKSTISKWEKGTTSPTIDRLQHVADVLGCDLVELLIDSVPARTEREKAALELFRGLEESQQQAFLQFVAPMAKPGADDDGDPASRPKPAAA